MESLSFTITSAAAATAEAAGEMGEYNHMECSGIGTSWPSVEWDCGSEAHEPHLSTWTGSFLVLPPSTWSLSHWYSVVAA